VEPDSRAEAFGRAAAKNVSALRYFAAGNLREALDFLNQAIVIAPVYPDSYANRASVFERMGLTPQAEADRRKARELADSARSREADASLPNPPPEADRPNEPSGAFPPRIFSQTPSRPRARSGTVSQLLRALGVLLVLGGFIVGAGLLVLSLVDGNSSDTGPGPGSPSARQSATPSPRSSPTAAPVAPGGGSPYNFSDLQRVWQAEKITAKPGPPASDFSGFAITPSDATLARGSESAEVAIFVYRGHEIPAQDWDLVIGKRPAAKAGRVIPAHVSIWWNANIVIVLRSSSGDITQDALDAFLTLGG